MHYFVSDNAAIAFVTAAYASYANVAIDEHLSGIIESDLAEEPDDIYDDEETPEQ